MSTSACTLGGPQTCTHPSGSAGRRQQRGGGAEATQGDATATGRRRRGEVSGARARRACLLQLRLAHPDLTRLLHERAEQRGLRGERARRAVGEAVHLLGAEACGEEERAQGPEAKRKRGGAARRRATGRARGAAEVRRSARGVECGAECVPGAAGRQGGAHRRRSCGSAAARSPRGARSGWSRDPGGRKTGGPRQECTTA